IEDSVDLFVEQTYAVGGRMGNPRLIRMLGEQSFSALEWLKSYGAVWSETFYQANGGLWPRSLDPDTCNTAGDIFLYNLQNPILEVGNTILTNTCAERLISDGGRVTGVFVRDVTTEKEFVVGANCGVVIATGGYAANTDMLNKFNIVTPLTSSSRPGNTGDGILMAMQAGAALVDMDYVQLHPSGNPKTGELQFHLVGESMRTIYINVEGERFVNEEGSWDAITSAVLKEPSMVMYVLMDSTQMGVYTHFEQDLNSGDLLMGNTLEELAHKMGVDETTLQKTVDTYNAGVYAGRPDAYSKKDRLPIDTPPYFATMRAPVIHYTLGGIKIDEDAQALDKYGKKVPGLYAAGEVTGGIYGTNRLCGSSLTETVVFGRIAGASAANGGGE
ncbi:FAD-binding protein, partial [Christensenellaceae bacterium OttesenSCG-928-M15]|nr:FAD-binding protein [Christensenellaceae bacterium OttesenSCG-928-M15]